MTQREPGKGSMRHSLLMAVGGRYVQITVSLVAVLAMARLLTPAEFGRFGIAASVVAISSSFRELGLFSYLIRIPVFERAAVARCLAVTGSMSLFVGGLVFLARGAIADYYREPELATLVGILCLNFILVPPSMAAFASLQRDMRFGLVNLIQVTSMLVSLAVALGLAFAGHGPLALAINQALSYFIQLVWAAIVVPRAVFVLPSFRGAAEVIRFGVPSTLAGVVNQAGLYASAIILGRLLGSTAVGLFERGAGLFNMVNNDLVGSIAQVLFVGIARVRDDAAELARLFRRSLRLLTGAIWPAYGMLAALAEPVITIMFGAQWAPATPVLRVLCLAGMLASGYIFYQRLIVAVGAMGTQLAVEAVGQGVRILGVLALASFGLAAAAGGTVLSMAVLAIAYASVARRFLQADRRVVAGIYIESALLAVAVGVVADIAAALVPAGWPPFAVLVIGGLAGLATWIAGLAMRRHDLLDEALDLLGRRKGAD